MERKKIEVIAYKQRTNWIVNQDGCIKHLHHSIKTKKQVKEYYERLGEEDNEHYKVVFG